MPVPQISFIPLAAIISLLSSPLLVLPSSPLPPPTSGFHATAYLLQMPVGNAAQRAGVTWAEGTQGRAHTNRQSWMTQAGSRCNRVATLKLPGGLRRTTMYQHTLAQQQYYYLQATEIYLQCIHQAAKKNLRML